jgi:hypothetical protein
MVPAATALECTMKRKKLRTDDSRAVDLLLDRSHCAKQTGRGVFASPAVEPAVRKRLGNVERLLHLLDASVAPDPPHDLVARTLRRIESGTHQSALPPLHCTTPVAADRLA